MGLGVLVSAPLRSWGALASVGLLPRIFLYFPPTSQIRAPDPAPIFPAPPQSPHLHRLPGTERDQEYDGYMALFHALK